MNLIRFSRVLLVCTVLSLATGIGTEALAQGLIVTGYADFEATVGDIDSGDKKVSFDNHHFNLIFLGKIYENVFAAAEVEFEHAGDEIALEYGYVGYTGIKNLRILVGKFIVPFGRFQKDLHPTWINKMPDRPHGFGNIFPSTYSDVGVWITGAVPLNEGTRVTYDAFVVNGLLGDEGGDIRDMRDNDRDKLSAGGRDDQKGFGGRAGLELPQHGFDAGVSAYTGNYLDNPDTNLTLTFLGADAAYVKSGLEVRAEVVYAKQELTVGDLDKTGGYVQIAYEIVKTKFEPIFRFSSRNMPGNDSDARRFSLGMNYYVAPSSAVRLAYHRNAEDDLFKTDNDVLIAQFTVGF